MPTPPFPGSVPAAHLTDTTTPSAPPAAAATVCLGPRIERTARRS